MLEIYTEFITVLTMTLIIIILPGPDFFIVLKNSLGNNKISGIFTSLGVGIGVWIHVSYSVIGTGILYHFSETLFSVLKYLGIIYLLYIGFSCLISKTNSFNFTTTKETARISNLKSFKMGFINNILNPKATLFFISLFTQVVSPDRNLLTKLLYGAIVSFTCIIWFSCISLVFNKIKNISIFNFEKIKIEKIVGVVLIFFAIRILLYSTIL